MDFSFATANEISKELGARLKIARLAKGLSQAELATRAGISLSTVKKLEKTGDCVLATLIKVAQALRIEGSFAELFKPGIQSIAELAQIEQATLKVRKRAPRKSR
ncbi:MAG TPA: helix-turn-helix transcriptional regulator [Eoetvoesiella sp.]